MAAPSPSNFDGNQVLQHAFEESTGRLRVDAEVTPGGSTEVEIDHANDSIRLGDGVDLVTATTVGSSVGLDVNLIGATNLEVTLDKDGIGQTPDVDNVTMAVAGSEYSYALVNGTKKITLKSRENGKLQITWTSGTSGSNYITIGPGSSYTIDNIDVGAGLVLYFQSTKTADTLEIMYWI